MKRPPMKTAAKKTLRARPAADSLQDTFLDELVKKRTRVTIFLMNGTKLEGEIESFDRYVILMRDASDKIYKHAISTIVPASDAPPAKGPVIEKKPLSKLKSRIVSRKPGTGER